MRLFDEIDNDTLGKIVAGFKHENWDFWRRWLHDTELQAIRNLEMRSPNGTPVDEQMMDVTRHRETIRVIRLIGTVAGELVQEYNKRHTP